ncbi:MAG: ABC transporter substrate-binding protein, partial [Terriglobia bacterium]
YKAIRSQACDPNGNVNVASLEKDWQFFKDSGQISGTVTVGSVMDKSFAEAAVASLGPFDRKSQ